jgi:hypothetical protein
MLTGQCFCGAIQYETAERIRNPAVCHCSICRRTTGAPAVAWFSVAAGDFRFTVGFPSSFRSSSHATRTFCPHCGTQLTFYDDDTPDEIDVTTSSLHRPEKALPQAHIFVADALQWPDDLPRYEQGRKTSR